MMIRTLINGFCMALADSVPGVSGGTIALILGFYDNFIGSIHDLIYAGKEKKKTAIIYLLKLFAGWAVGMLLAILALTAFFEKNIYAVSSLFLGFVLCSIPVIMQEEWKSIKGKWFNLIFTAIGIALVVLLSYLNTSISQNVSDLSHFTITSAVYIFVAGAVAICAMFLPGISGSTVLLIFGVYMPILNSVKELLHLKFEYLPAVIVFGVGVLSGAVLSVKGIQTCLEKFRSQTVYMIVGMLIGSLYAIVMGPTTLSTANQPLLPNHFNILWFIIGIAIIGAIQLIKYLSEKNKKEKSE